jgi:2-iminobutanoate/2-iminopropanoate deaminase
MASAYSPIHEAGSWRCVSGQVGLTADGLADNFSDQLDATLANLGALLEANGLRLDQVVKTTVFLTDMGDYDALNERYVDFFGGHLPARSTVVVSALPMGALVEIEAWAYVG